VTCLRVDNWLGVGLVVVSLSGGSCIAFVDDLGGGCWLGARGCIAQHTLTKCPILLQSWQVLLYTGQCACPA